MKLLITGATGFVGRHLVKRLVRRHAITALVRDPARARLGSAVRLLAVDLSRPLTRRLPTVDAVVHLAQGHRPPSDPTAQVYSVNVLATHTLLDYARERGLRHFVLASTGSVYGNPLGRARETDPFDPQDTYARSKSIAEKRVWLYDEDVPCCILRLYYPYGPGQVDRLVPRLAAQIRAGRPVRVHAGGRPDLTPMYITDVVRALTHVINHGVTGVLNVCGDECVSVPALARAVGRAVGAKPSFEESGEASGDTAGDNTRMKEVLGAWPLVPLAEGLKQTFV